MGIDHRSLNILMAEKLLNFPDIDPLHQYDCHARWDSAHCKWDKGVSKRNAAYFVSLVVEENKKRTLCDLCVSAVNYYEIASREFRNSVTIRLIFDVPSCC